MVWLQYISLAYPSGEKGDFLLGQRISTWLPSLRLLEGGEVSALWVTFCILIRTETNILELISSCGLKGV